MTMSRPKLVALVIPLLLAGCVPTKLSGYRPAGNGSLESGFCVAGIRDRLRVSAPAGVELLLYTVAQGYRAAVLLNVDLFVPASATAQWVSPKLLLRSPEWTRPRAWMIDRIVAGSKTFDATAVLAGSRAGRTPAYRLTFYSTEMGTIAEPSIPLASEFTLELPALKINGEPFHPGPVQFEAYSEWGVYTCAQ